MSPAPIPLLVERTRQTYASVSSSYPTTTCATVGTFYGEVYRRSEQNIVVTRQPEAAETIETNSVSVKFRYDKNPALAGSCPLIFIGDTIRPTPNYRGRLTALSGFKGVVERIRTYPMEIQIDLRIGTEGGSPGAPPAGPYFNPANNI